MLLGERKGHRRRDPGACADGCAGGLGSVAEAAQGTCAALPDLLGGCGECLGSCVGQLGGCAEGLGECLSTGGECAGEVLNAAAVLDC